MNRLIFILFILLPACTLARPNSKITVLYKDSLVNNTSGVILDSNWRFHKGDVPGFADTSFNDNNWETIAAKVRDDSELERKRGYYSRIDCYRLSFSVDSPVLSLPLAFLMTCNGAAEIYLDGKKIQSFGAIKSKDSSWFFAPHHSPFIVAIKSPGVHLLAVRFANYATKSIFKNDWVNQTGFTMSVAEANNMNLSVYSNLVGNTTVTVFLFSVFLVLFFIHLLLFLYYRSVVSNLYFSIFCLSLSAVFCLLYFSSFSDDPDKLILFNMSVLPLTMSILFFSFSGINNQLFSTGKIRFRIIAILSFIPLVINFFNGDFATFAFIGVGVLVIIEAIVLPIAGIYKKVKGARIVGSGVLFFAIFILIIAGYLLIYHTLHFSNDNIGGLIFLIAMSCAILSIPFSMSVYLSWNFAAMNKELKKHLHQVEVLSARTLEQEQEKKRILEGQKENLEQQVNARTAEVVAQKEKIEKQRDELTIEKKKSDDLLRNILPEEVAEELKQKGSSEAKAFDEVTVLFTDFVDFTKAGESMPAKELVSELNTCFRAFDEIMAMHNIEKIKTIGDAYLAVCGLPLPDPAHALRVVSASLEIMKFMAERKLQLKDKTFEIRIGIHSGGVVAGIVGVKKFAYDIWGDTVNTAARMEQNSIAGRINISETVYNLVKDHYKCIYRDKVNVKNKGEMSMYFIEGVQGDQQ